jgi:hypothetical protein
MTGSGIRLFQGINAARAEFVDPWQLAFYVLKPSHNLALSMRVGQVLSSERCPLSRLPRSFAETLKDGFRLGPRNVSATHH